MLYNIYFSDVNNYKESNDAPEWFNIIPDWKLKKYKENLARNEETIRIISKHQSWITTTPMSNDRRHPLEKLKVSKREETSKLMPKWMEIKYKSCKREVVLKSVEYSPIKQKCKKLMVFVDKDINPPKIKKLNYDKNRSIFSYGDFRHNVVTKKEHEYYDSKVSQEPKKFFDWDDKKRFNPKYKKDI